MVEAIDDAFSVLMLFCSFFSSPLFLAALVCFFCFFETSSR